MCKDNGCARNHLAIPDVNETTTRLPTTCHQSHCEYLHQRKNACTYFYGNESTSVTPPSFKVRPSAMALRVTETTFAKDVFTRQKKNQRLRPSHLATQIDIWKQTKVTGTSSAYLAANSFRRIRTGPFQEPSPRENSDITKKPLAEQNKKQHLGIAQKRI